MPREVVVPSRRLGSLAVAALSVVAAASCGGDSSAGGTAPRGHADASAPDASVPADTGGAADTAAGAADSAAAADTSAGDQLAPDAEDAQTDANLPDQSSEAGDGGGATYNPRPCAFYVAASGGDDTGPGTSAKPFATLARLRTALRGAATKVACLKAGSGGSYDLTAPLVLSKGTDDGETWESDPAGGVDSAVLDGGGTVSCLVQTDASGITLDGLKLQHVINNLTCHDDGTTTIANLTVTNCDVGFNTAGPGSGGFPPCVMANGANGVTIAHNYIHDCASEGIGLFSYQSGLVLDNVVVDSNVVLRAVQKVPDGGAIYLMHHNNYAASHVAVTNNFVRDHGAATVNKAHGIYLDEGTNHVVVSGNVIAAPTPGSADATGCLIADGHDNRFAGNVCDLGATGVVWAGVWWYPGNEGFTPANNFFTGNIVLSRFAGNQMTNAYGVSGPSFVQIASPATDPSITANLYHNYAGGQARTDGNHVSDGSPELADPLCSGYLYALAPGSPALAAPVSFAPIVGGWGPPGFVIPAETTGSCP